MNRPTTALAVFVGEDGSLGYKKNRQYRVTLHTDPKSKQIDLWSTESPETSAVKYDSISSFLQNWDCVRRVGQPRL
jgi:hypothetical protein